MKWHTSLLAKIANHITFSQANVPESHKILLNHWIDLIPDDFILQILVPDFYNFSVSIPFQSYT